MAYLEIQCDDASSNGYLNREIERKFLGHKDVKGRKFTGRTMYMIEKFYDLNLREGNYEKVINYEARFTIPKTWLTSVISKLIQKYEDAKKIGNARKLMKEFGDITHCSVWLEKSRAQDIKGIENSSRYMTICSEFSNKTISDKSHASHEIAYKNGKYHHV
ncbi:MAG: hypothetical protein Q7S74_01225 [Nanoarchaeota archaeon]|nr:hypothetical protein [Nanoarchaeota archaeon]